MLTYVFWFGIINKSSRETHKTTTTEYVMERYRSGHNEAVVGSNPTLSVHHDRIHDVNPWRSTQVAEGARLESE